MSGPPSDDAQAAWTGPAASWPDGSTRLFAVLGHPVAHSRSPAIMNGLFRVRARNSLYLALPVPRSDLPDVLRVLHRLPFDGLNMTHPLKEAAAGLCDELCPVARRLGAVNTLVRREEGWRGTSTDGPGLVMALREELGVEPAGVETVILGAGGAGRAAALALREAGAAPLTVVTRDGLRFQSAFFRKLREEGARGLEADAPAARDALARAELVVHATPYGLGLSPEHELPAAAWDLSVLPASCRVVDMNYRLDGPSAFLRRIPAGVRAADGRGMLAGQAARAFEVWTGELPGFREALEAGGLSAAP